jgi:hypothetical protein
VLSVPPHFDAVQRSVLSDAAATVTAATAGAAATDGWLVAGTIDEPVAAVAAALDTGALPAEVRASSMNYIQSLIALLSVITMVYDTYTYIPKTEHPCVGGSSLSCDSSKSILLKYN